MRLWVSLLITISTFGTTAIAETICINAPYLTFAGERQRELVQLIDTFRPTLKNYPTMLEVLETHSPDICLSDRMDLAHAYLDIETNRIILSADLPHDIRPGVMLHEIRHLWQYSQGSCPTDDLAMKEYARATLALEADASAISLMIAWEIKEQGDSSVWNALSTWPSHEDIAARYEATISSGEEAGLAATSAFHQWYASDWRRNRYYVAACSEYLDRQDASHRIPQYELIDESFFEDLCKLPQGDAYSCGEPDPEL